MKKILFLLCLMCMGVFSAAAQKLALVDMDYILKKDPAYELMNKQLEELSKRWQSEVSALETKAQAAYKSYQTDIAFLSAEQKKAREEAIVSAEKQAYELKRRYFGPEGELVKRRETQMKPIQDKVWQAMKTLARTQGYQLIIDRTSSKIVYADPSLDISDTLAAQLGLR